MHFLKTTLRDTRPSSNGKRNRRDQWDNSKNKNLYVKPIYFYKKYYRALDEIKVSLYFTTFYYDLNFVNHL